MGKSRGLRGGSCVALFYLFFTILNNINPLLFQRGLISHVFKCRTGKLQDKHGKGRLVGIIFLCIIFPRIILLKATLQRGIASTACLHRQVQCNGTSALNLHVHFLVATSGVCRVVLMLNSNLRTVRKRTEMNGVLISRVC